MAQLDVLVIVLYLLLIFAVGWWAGNLQSDETEEGFFLGGRKLPWWLLGTSMVATTLAADTPLTVAGLTCNKGIAGNWFWWSFVVSHVLVAVMLGRLWRRASVVTDAEFCELRYADGGAKYLRKLKAFYFAIPINCIVMGWVFAAMLKVSEAVLPNVAPWQLTGGLLLLTLIYSLRSGFQGVVLTDLIQFPIALGGSVLLAVVAVKKSGGMVAVLEGAVAAKGDTVLEIMPVGGELLPLQTILAYLGVQWWAQKYADGGGILIQRLSAARSERDAELGGLWFTFAHYVLRPWPWIVTGLAAFTLVPEAVALDAERAYAVMLVEILPDGFRGLLIAAFLAAFMSTVDTHLNWGASYLVNDLLKGHFPKKHQGIVTRVTVLFMAFCAIISTLYIDSIASAWEFLVAFGSGSGAVILLRWYWWRVTAWTEISAILASTVISIGVYVWGPEDLSYLYKLLIIVVGSAMVWVPVCLWTSPTPHSLDQFYRQVRPPGPGWRAVTNVSNAPPPVALMPEVVRWLSSLGGVFAGLFGVGFLVLETQSSIHSEQNRLGA